MNSDFDIAKPEGHTGMCKSLLPTKASKLYFICIVSTSLRSIDSISGFIG